MKINIKIVTVLLSMLLLCGCSDIVISSNDSVDSEKVSSSEEISYNSSPISSSEEIIEDSNCESDNNSLIEKLKTTPSKEGYVFSGWYSDIYFTNLVTTYSNLDGITNVYPKFVFINQKNYNVRNYEVSITDSGRRKQPIDEEKLHLYYDYFELKKLGYKYFEVQVSWMAKEKDDGYQHILLYSDTNCPNTGTVGYFITDKVLGKDVQDPSLLCWYSFEHNVGEKDTSWRSYNFTTVISLDDLKDKIYIRYDASGNFNDTWNNKNINVKVKPLK